MDVLISAAFRLVIAVLELYIIIVFVEVVLSWLMAFDVVNARNRFVNMVRSVTYALTEPALRPIRNLLQRILPNLGGIDLSPIVLLLLIYFVIDLLQGFYVRFAIPS
jgi:YggT family protein